MIGCSASERVKFLTKLAWFGLKPHSLDGNGRKILKAWLGTFAQMLQTEIVQSLQSLGVSMTSCIVNRCETSLILVEPCPLRTYL